jgi:hypothetical protein
LLDRECVCACVQAPAVLSTSASCIYNLGANFGTRDLQPPRGGPGNISDALKESSMELRLSPLELVDG